MRWAAGRSRTSSERRRNWRFSRPGACGTSRSGRRRQIEIDALLNRPQGGRIEIPAEMTAGEMPAPLEDMLAQARAHSPLVGRSRDVVQGNELAASLARKDYAPDYTVSGGYFNQGGMPPMWQARVDFKLPAYFWRKQRAAVDEREASASQARHEYAATLRGDRGWHPRAIQCGRGVAQAGGPVREVGDSRGAAGIRIRAGRLPGRARRTSSRCSPVSPAWWITN